MNEWRGHIRLLTRARARSCACPAHVSVLVFFAQHQLYVYCNCCCNVPPLAIATVFVGAICVDDCWYGVGCECVRALLWIRKHRRTRFDGTTASHSSCSHMAPTKPSEFPYKYGADSVEQSFQSFISSSQHNPILNSPFAAQHRLNQPSQYGEPYELSKFTRSIAVH